MAERSAPVVNASPLIFLARASLLDLLSLLGTEIVVPAAVAMEIRQRPMTDVTVRALDTLDWLVIKPTEAPPASIQSWDLGAGESAVLSYALRHPGCEAILDDLAARRCAAAFGIPVRGTLGLVLVAKKRGYVTSARETIEKLRLTGMYLSDHVVARALAMVGE